ncbi:MAG: tyrosine-type recombinase/integrase [Limisphaerales bacterium]
MITLSETITAGAQSPVTKRTPRSTKKSIWWKRGEHLVQHTPTGTFYCRLKFKGKTIRASLNTDVFTTARLRLPDKLKVLRKPKAETGTFGDGRLKYEAETRNGYTSKKNRFVKLAPLSIAYRLRCLECLRRSLVETLIHPGKTWKSLSEQTRHDAFAKLDAMNARAFTQEHCGAWQSRFSDYAPSVFNNTVNTFRRVLELAGLPHDDNPAFKIGRRDILEKPIRLPRPEQFDRILELIETSGAAQAKDCANLARFLAYTGARISEAKQAVWGDVNWQENTLTIHSVKVRGAHDGSVTRTLPMNPALRQHLEQLSQGKQPEPSDHICSVFECQKSLDRACRLAGCKRLVHHDLRHYFVTKCLQAGVGVFTLAKWIGHRDNGKLLLKVYAHLQAEHSQQQANLVQFGATPLPENVPQLPAATTAN